MIHWTPERRLQLLADLIGRKREESLGRAPSSPVNYETLLVITSAPEHVLKTELGDLDAVYREVDAKKRTHEGHFSQICADARDIFGARAPSWAKEGA